MSVSFYRHALVLALAAVLALRSTPPVHAQAGSRPGAGLEMPTDSSNRSFVVVGTPSTLTIRMPGRRPTGVELGQRGTAAGGIVFFGDAGAHTSVRVTTRGGDENVARILVRADPNRPSRRPGDLTLTASVDGRERAAWPVTVLRLAVDEKVTTLANDAPVIRTLTTTPHTPGLRLGFRFFRGMAADGSGVPVAETETTSSVDVFPLRGTTIRTGTDGSVRFLAKAGHGGQGRVYGRLSVDELGVSVPIDFVLNQPRLCGGACCKIDPADPEDTAFGAIGLYAGERQVCETDLSLLGREIDFRIQRSYRSQASHLRSAGSPDFAVDWAMSYIDDRLIADGKNVIVVRPELRTDVFVATPVPGKYLAPMEFYEQLTRSESGNFELRDAGGMVRVYRGFHDQHAPGRLHLMRDRDGNTMSFIYGRPRGLSKTVLVTVVDSMGRNIHYRYYGDHETPAGRRGRLREIEDFRREERETGRRIRFDYDETGNLVSVSSPAVIGTPNGNDFPYGKTIRYFYSAEKDVPIDLDPHHRRRLLHNLVAVQYPNETAVDLDPGNPQTLTTPRGTCREVSIYGADPEDHASFDRVVTHVLGGVNGSGVPAGGALEFHYEIQAIAASTPNDAYLSNRVRDRAGNVTVYLYSPFDTLLSRDELTRGLRRHEPHAFTTVYRYNRDKELVRRILPEGNRVDHTFDEHNPDRFQQGNRIRSVQTPDEARGGDQSAIVREWSFEPVFQQPAATTDPRGLDPEFQPPIPDPSDRARRERYTTRQFFDYQEAPAHDVLPLLAQELKASPAEVRARLEAAGIELGLGDLNGDGRIETDVHGDVVRMAAPAVVLLAGSNQAAVEGDPLQDMVTLYRYNDFGQKTSTVDPEGNVHVYHYFPESDPDGDGALSPRPADRRALSRGTGGYLRLEVRDSAAGPHRNNRTPSGPTQIGTSYAYDDVGNVTSRTDGRGIRTDFFVNELDQVVRKTHAAAIPARGVGSPPEPLDLTAFRYMENTFYDFNNNVTKWQIEDRGNTSNTGGFVDHDFKYDILDQRIEARREVDLTKSLITRQRFDRNGNDVLVIYPEGNAVSAVPDERDLKLKSILGVSRRPPAGLYGAGDPTVFDRPGGVGTRPSITVLSYDGNRNVIERVDAEPHGTVGSEIAGVGDVSRFSYDGFDRLRRKTDPLGNQERRSYDPASHVVRTIWDGEPDDDVAGAAGNRTLAVTEEVHDEVGRVVASHLVLFPTPGSAPARTPVLTDTAEMDTLAPYLADAAGDEAPVPGALGIEVVGRVTTIMEFDRKGRTSFVVRDDLDSVRMDYDGADRMVRTTDSALSHGFADGAFDPQRMAGNQVELAYDDNGNLIEQKETDVSSLPGLENEIFRTTYVHDSLNRLQTTFDNRGQTTDLRYDSRDNLVTTADALGPVGGRTMSRRGLGSSAAVALNDFGNVERSRYDGNNRLLEHEIVLTASGRGNGSDIGATIEGVLSPAPEQDVRQSGDGRISTYYAYDDNSQLIALRDDNGHITAYVYDNQDRPLVERKGLASGAIGLTVEGGDSVAFNVPVLGGITATDSEPRGTDIRIAYDRDDNRVLKTDEAGNRLAFSFDALDRRRACRIIRAPGFGGTTRQTWSYDGLSRLTRCLDDNEPELEEDDSECRHFYDSLSREVEEWQRIGVLAPKVISSRYDIAAGAATGRPTSLTYPDGRRVDSFYDRLDRLVRKRDHARPSDLGRYAYLGQDRVAALTYQNGIRLTHVGQDGGRNADVGFDDLRRVVDHRWERFSGTEALGRGRLVVGFGHRDGDGRPAYDRVSNKLIEEKQHDPDSSEVFLYDSAYRLTDPGSSYRGLEGAFRRGTLNRRKSEIASSTRRPGRKQKEDWILDGVGNWQLNAMSVEGSGSVNESRVHSDLNEIELRSVGAARTAQTLDRNGNVTDTGLAAVGDTAVGETTFAGGGLRLEWDAWNRLRRVYDNNRTAGISDDDRLLARLAYDCQNRRIRLTTGADSPAAAGETTDYYHQRWRVLEERDGDDAVTRQYVYGNYLDEVWILDDRRGGISLAELDDGRGGERKFYLHNTLASVHALTDEAGGLVEAYQYDAYGLPSIWSDPGSDGRFFTDDDVAAVSAGGAPVSSVGNSRLFTGQYWIPLDAVGSGLYYFKNRYYSSDLGRFLSRDPIGYMGESLGLYQYVASNPVMARDPLGLWYAYQHKELTRDSFKEAQKKLPGCLGAGRDCAKRVLGWITEHNLLQDDIDSSFGENQRHFNRSVKGANVNFQWWIDAFKKYLKREATNFGDRMKKSNGSTDIGLSNCKESLKIIGRLTHSWQDFYSHAVQAQMTGNSVTGIDKKIFSGSRPPAATPTNPGKGGIIPSSWAGKCSPGEHGWCEPSGKEGKARMRQAVSFVSSEYDTYLRQWEEKCCCACGLIGKVRKTTSLKRIWPPKGWFSWLR